MKLYIFLIFTLFHFSKSQYGRRNNDPRDIMSFLRYCQEDTLSFEKCLKTTLEELRPYLAEGIPEYNIPGIEPIYINETIEEHVSSMQIESSDFVVHGLTDFFVRKVSLNDMQRIVVDIDVPKIRIKGKYTVSGSLLRFPVLPVRGHGDMEVNMTDCTFKTIAHTSVYESGSETHMKFTFIDVRMKVEGGRILFEDFKGGNQNLIGPMNYMVNDNFRNFIIQLVPPIEKVLEQLIFSVGNSIGENFSFQQLFS